MKLLEQLTEAGIDKETADKVMEVLKKRKNPEEDGYVKTDKHEKIVSELTADLEKLKAEAAVNEKKLVDLGKYEELKVEHAKLQVEKTKELSSLRIGFEIEKKLAADKIPPIGGSYEAYMSQFGEDISVVDGKVVGFDKAYEAFKKNNAAIYDLIGTTTVPPNQPPPNTPPQNKQKVFAEMTVDERIRLKQENPALFVQLNEKHEKERKVF
jgi:hypothetical protein